MNAMASPSVRAAVNLSFHDHGIDHVAAIVHGDKTAHLDFACSFVDIDHANVSSKRKSKVGRDVGKAE